MNQAFALKLIVKEGDSVLVQETGKGYCFPVYLCRKEELPQNAARRILNEVFGIQNAALVSMPSVSRIAVGFFSAEEHAGWPSGARTIPCVTFLATGHPMSSASLRSVPLKDIQPHFFLKEDRENVASINL